MMINRCFSLLRTSLQYYNFSSMKLKIDEQNYVVLDPAKGARIL
jgi:hypothetical protein